jgi:hypothetical protein
MVDGFAETFPGAPLNGLVEPHIGANWAGAKSREKRTVEPTVDYGLVFEAHLKATRGNYPADSEEPGLRSLDHTVRAYCNNNPGVSIDDARTAVLAAVATKRKTPMSVDEVM